MAFASIIDLDQPRFPPSLIKVILIHFIVNDLSFLHTDSKLIRLDGSPDIMSLPLIQMHHKQFTYGAAQI